MSGISVVEGPKESVIDYVRNAFSSVYASLCSLVAAEEQKTVEQVKNVSQFKRFDEQAAEREIMRRCQEASRRYSLDTVLYRAGKTKSAPEFIDCLDVELHEGDPSKIFAPYGLEFIADYQGSAPRCETYVGPRSEIETIEKTIQERLLEYGGRAIIGKSSVESEVKGITTNKLWPPRHHYVFPTPEEKPKSESL